MRDIRDDLRVRRAAVIGRYSDAMHRFEVEIERLHKDRREAIDTFEQQKATLDAMIAFENRQQEASVEGSATVQPTAVSLRDFIVTKIQTDGPIGKDQLAALAAVAGYAERGRTFNMTLQNVAKGSRVKRLADGRYADSETPAPLFGMDRTTGETPMIAQ